MGGRRAADEADPAAEDQPVRRPAAAGHGDPEAPGRGGRHPGEGVPGPVGRPPLDRDPAPRQCRAPGVEQPAADRGGPAGGPRDAEPGPGAGRPHRGRRSAVAGRVERADLERVRRVRRQPGVAGGPVARRHGPGRQPGGGHPVAGDAGDAGVRRGAPGHPGAADAAGHRDAAGGAGQHRVAAVDGDVVEVPALGPELAVPAHLELRPDRPPGVRRQVDAARGPAVAEAAEAGGPGPGADHGPLRPVHPGQTRGLLGAGRVLDVVDQHQPAVEVGAR